jgi:glutamate/tyrosine decarboxylase-like PLP-dependent enzyme
MLSDLYNAPCPPEDAVGAACIGSSEAIMLAGGPSTSFVPAWPAPS